MKPRFYLVDAHAFLHRAYHALPPLTNAKGEPVGALYGFARMLLQILKRDKPDRIAVCFDSPGPTVRHKLFADYKATRKDADEDLVFQLGQAHGMAEAMGFTCVARSGVEHQFRTTYVPALLSAGDLHSIATALPAGEKHVVQPFRPEHALDPFLRGAAEIA